MKRVAIGRWARRHRLSARALGEIRVAQLSGRRGEADLQRCMSLARDGSLFIDVGANVGNYALAACRKVGRSGAVLALEANPDVYRELITSTWGARVIALNLAASDRSGLATLEVPVDRLGSVQSQLGSLESRSSGGSLSFHNVRTIRVDDLIGGEQIVSVIKIDVEGHELSVLKGAEETIERDRPSLVIEIEARHLVDHEIRDVVEWILAKGYDGFVIDGQGLLPWREFDAYQHQARWLTEVDGSSVITDGAPYLNNFLFTPIHSDSLLSDEIDTAAQKARGQSLEGR